MKLYNPKNILNIEENFFLVDILENFLILWRPLYNVYIEKSSVLGKHYIDLYIVTYMVDIDWI